MKRPLRAVGRLVALLVLSTPAWAAPPRVPPPRAMVVATTAAVATRWPRVEERVLRDLATGTRAPVMVLLADQADVGTAATMSDAGAQGWYVFGHLRDHATRTQDGILALLARRGAPAVSFWAVNAVATTVDDALLRELFARPDVGAIESNAESRWIDGPDAGDAGDAPRAGDGNGDTSTAAAWGVDAVRAPQVWALGDLGQGMVVASADTGVQWTHPALMGQYRGWNGLGARHDHSWHDAIHDAKGNPCPNDSVAPCDDDGHGTRTTGTMVGDDGLDNRVGVAPGARWMGCRNMDRGFGTPARYLECMEFFLAPTDSAGQAPDPDLRPHVINNSWGCPNGEGCAPATLEGLVDNLVAAGIFFVVAAGNAGPGCGSVNDPPALYPSSFTVGAYDVDGVMASFSSRGPVLVDFTGIPKPDLSAPGVNVRSSVAGGGYGDASGTSLAAPHVSGVVALLWSAHPELIRRVNETRLTLQASAIPSVVLPAVESCGGVTSDFTPNHTFGAGRLDALRAVQW